jgi:hypothetical protein
MAIINLLFFPDEEENVYDGAIRRLRFKTPPSIRRRVQSSRKALEESVEPIGRAALTFVESKSDVLCSHLTTIRSEQRKAHHEVSGRLKAISDQLEQVAKNSLMAAASQHPLTLKATWAADLKLPWTTIEDMQ